MSIEGMRHTGLSVMRASQEATVRVSDNLANANTPGRHRKEIIISQNLTGRESRGIVFEGSKRAKDPFLLLKVIEHSGYTGHKKVTFESMDKVMAVFGTPDDGKSITDSYGKILSAISELKSAPNAGIRRSTVIEAIEKLTNELNRMGKTVQELRTAAHQELGQYVQEASEKIQTIDDINLQISFSKGQDTSELEDRRDLAVKDLGQLLDIKVLVNSKGAYELSLAGSGVGILQNITAKLDYAVVGSINENYLYVPPGGTQPVGTTPLPEIFLNNQTDITNQISSGVIAGLIELRDSLLPKIQANLDEITMQLRDQFNSMHNNGTASPPPEELTGVRIVQNSDPINATGTLRLAALDSTTGDIANFNDFNLNSYSTMGSLVSALNSTPGVSCIINSDNKLHISATNSGQGIGIVSLTNEDSNITATNGNKYGFSHYFGLNNIIDTGSRYVDDNSNVVGITQTISLNDRLRTTPDNFTQGKLNIDPALTIGDNGIPQSATDLLIVMMQKTNSAIDVNSSGDLGAQSITLSNYMSLVISGVARNTKAQEDAYDRENGSLESYRRNLLEKVRILDDSEFATLLQFSKLMEYGAKIVNIAGEMTNALLSLKG